MNLDELKFDEKGLIPAIVVDDETGKVLTLAYMNRESLAISMEKKLTCFWSRSRQELWLKGETSGNYQHIVSITADCDGDALEVRVKKDGPACHTGEESCFFNPVFGEKNDKFQLEGLYQLLVSRKKELPEGSYTTYLFQKGLDKILKRIEFNCNLAYGTLSDPQNVDKTAEEIRSSKQRSYSAVCDVQQALQGALEHLVWAMDFYATLYKLAPRGEYEVNFTWGDGVLQDTDKEYMRRKEMADNGYLRPEKFVAWYFGISEEEAKDYLPEAAPPMFGEE